MDAETLYLTLRHSAEQEGFVSERADELLAEVADEMANDPRNNEE